MRRECRCRVSAVRGGTVRGGRESGERENGGTVGRVGGGSLLHSGGGRRAAGQSKGERRNVCRHVECVLLCASRRTCETTWPATEHILYGHVVNTLAKWPYREHILYRHMENTCYATHEPPHQPFSQRQPQPLQPPSPVNFFLHYSNFCFTIFINVLGHGRLEPPFERVDVLIGRLSVWTF